MESKNKKPLIFIALLFSVFLIVGGTIAYYTSSDTFNNEFDTGTYKIETQEAFVSPDNWTPGTTTPKTVIATNKGSTPAAVRIKLTPSWVDANGDPLPLKDGNDNEAAIINFASNLNSKWIYDNGYYYYKKALNENDSTTSLIDSVTFNPDFNISNTKDCETVNGVTTCTTEFIDYAGGKYTLQIEVETAQFDKYKEIWSTDVNLKVPKPLDKILMVNEYDYDNPKTFGKDIDRSSFESVITVDNIDVPSTAIDSWDCSEAQNESVMCWYTDTDNDSKYELYIGQVGGVIANPNSKDLFSSFMNAETIDLTYFDTSSVIDMSNMFSNVGFNTTTFELDLSGFDTSEVTNMEGMFFHAGYNATAINLNLSGWDTSSVTDMSGMFSSMGFSVSNFELDLSGLDTSQVTNMHDMFFNAGYNATTFELDLSGWDTSKVTNMEGMFWTAGYSSTTWSIGDLSGWDVSNVINMSYLFDSSGYNSTTWSVGDLSGWNVSKVTKMNQMFSRAGHSSTTWNVGDIGRWDTSKVTDMGAMFTEAGYSATTFNLDLSRWNTSSVTSMHSLFNNAGHSAATWNIGDLSGWDASQATSMQNMFTYAGRNATTWNSIGTLKVYATYISYMFNNCPNAKATLNIYSNPTGYYGAFSAAATTQGSGITVNYSSTTTNINSIVATKSNNSNVAKGVQLD